MLYTYKCVQCGQEMDRFFKLEDYPREIGCQKCGGSAKKILSIGHGGIQTDGNVPWLASACDTLQSSRERKERPITTRTEWRAEKERKGLISVG